MYMVISRKVEIPLLPKYEKKSSLIINELGNAHHNLPTLQLIFLKYVCRCCTLAAENSPAL